MNYEFYKTNYQFKVQTIAKLSAFRSKELKNLLSYAFSFFFHLFLREIEPTRDKIFTTVSRNIKE